MRYQDVLHKVAIDQRTIDITRRSEEPGWRPTRDDMDALSEISNDYGMEGSDTYAHKELAPFINGIGGENDKWPRVLADWWMPGSSVAAGIHDIDYRRGGTETDRQKADSRFLRNLGRVADKDYSYSDKATAYENFINWLKSTILPKLGYHSVRLGGKSHFSYRDKPLTLNQVAKT